MDFSRDVLYRSFGYKSNHILCSGPMCRPPQYQDGRARRSPTTNRSKLAINSFSSSHITSQILTQINGRRHKQFTLFIFLGFFLQLELPGWCPVGAADLLSEGAAHVRSPTPGTDQTWGGNQKWIDNV